MTVTILALIFFAGLWIGGENVDRGNTKTTIISYTVALLAFAAIIYIRLWQ